MTSRDRSWRRAQRQRLLAKRFSYYNAFYSHESYCEATHDERARRLGRMARTPKLCSCLGCGNPRKIRRNDDPMQEKVAKDKCKDAYREWNQKSDSTEETL